MFAFYYWGDRFTVEAKHDSTPEIVARALKYLKMIKFYIFKVVSNKSFYFIVFCASILIVIAAVVTFKFTAEIYY